MYMVSRPPMATAGRSRSAVLTTTFLVACACVLPPGLVRGLSLEHGLKVQEKLHATPKVSVPGKGTVYKASAKTVTLPDALGKKVSVPGKGTVYKASAKKVSVHGNGTLPDASGKVSVLGNGTVPNASAKKVFVLGNGTVRNASATVKKISMHGNGMVKKISVHGNGTGVDASAKKVAVPVPSNGTVQHAASARKVAAPSNGTVQYNASGKNVAAPSNGTGQHDASGKKVDALVNGKNASGKKDAAPGNASEKKVSVPGVAFDYLFHGGAVLQRGAEVQVWGTAFLARGDSPVIRLELDGKPVANASVSVSGGRWQASLPPQVAGWGRRLRAVLGNKSTETTVNFGEVVMCSGQSNMAMGVFNEPGLFAAHNGSEESSAASRYTGKISLASVRSRTFPAGRWNGTGCMHLNPNYKKPCTNNLTWNKATPATVAGYSALCWYTGRDLFDRLGGKVPVGLILGAIGGSSIEFWIPEHVQRSTCGMEATTCGDTHINASEFFNYHISPFAPYTLGTVVWDQGERNVHCFANKSHEENTTRRYPCMQKELIRSWREVFQSSFAFVAVQLPGYFGDCSARRPNRRSTFRMCVPGVFDMRLAQESGTSGDPRAAVVPTYDLGCPASDDSPECPWGSVHNLRKAPIGGRVAAEVLRLLDTAAERSYFGGSVSVVAKGPDNQSPRVAAVSYRVQSSTLAQASSSEVTVRFFGGTGPLQLKGTQFCDWCCTNGSVGDFDASGDDGNTWVNATAIPRMVNDSSVAFVIPLPRVTDVRYTGNQPFPQCAVYNQEGLPAFPFQMKLTGFFGRPVA